MSRSDGSADLSDTEIVVGVTGGIAAYKTCYVASQLVQRGAGVTCVMTRSARRFVTPLTFETLTGRKVLTSLWRSNVSSDPQHIHLAQRADLCIVAPATANIIAKIAHGIADDVLSTVLIALQCPLIVAPAMNSAMWANRVVADNIRRLTEIGHEIVGPATGWQACRTIGPGRMEEPDVIVAAAIDKLAAMPRRARSAD